MFRHLLLKSHLVSRLFLFFYNVVLSKQNIHGPNYGYDHSQIAQRKGTNHITDLSTFTPWRFQRAVDNRKVQEKWRSQGFSPSPHLSLQNITLFFSICEQTEVIQTQWRPSSGFQGFRQRSGISSPASAWTVVCSRAELKRVKVLLSAGQLPTSDVTNVFMHFHKFTKQPQESAPASPPRDFDIQAKPPTGYSETYRFFLFIQTRFNSFTQEEEKQKKKRVQDCIQSTKNSSSPEKYCLSRSTNGYKWKKIHHCRRVQRLLI